MSPLKLKIDNDVCKKATVLIFNLYPVFLFGVGIKSAQNEDFFSIVRMIGGESELNALKLFDSKLNFSLLGEAVERQKSR